MGFSCSITGKNGLDLLKKYDIDRKLLGIAPDSGSASLIMFPNALHEIREVFSSNKYGEYCREAALDILNEAQNLVRDNFESLTHMHHCDTCTCVQDYEKEIPVFEKWDKEMAKRFLSIPLEEVERAWGGW